MLSHHRGLATVIASAHALKNPSTAGVTVTATETDFKISLSQSAFKPGAYTFKVLNQGQASHNLTIDGPGVDKQASPTMPGGGSGEVSVTLQAGTYELLCSVADHEGRGMDMKITVG